MEARDREVAWNKVMKAWGSGDEKVVAKNFELLFNAAQSEDQAKDPELPRRWKSKSTLGSGVGGPHFKKFHPHLTESVPQVGDLHPMTLAASSWRVWGVGRSSPTPMSPPTPRCSPPNSRDISGCHLSSFLCLSEDYQVAVQAGTALGEVGEASWDTIELQRGDMLLMVATIATMGCPPSPTPRMGYRGLFFTCGPPTANTNTTSPTPHTWTPHPQGGPGRCWGFVQLGLP